MSTIAEIKQRLDIAQVISEYVSLKKAGRNFKALCPFHSEKDPSFYVFTDRQSWHCFGACGTGGDVFAFVMKKENLEFGQALQLLADKTGVSLPGRPQIQEKAKDELRDKLYQINETVAGYYHHVLLNTSVGEAARKYLAQRGLTAQTLTNFQLGLSLDQWNNTEQYLISKGYKKEELLSAGLVIKREDGGIYDRYRNRLMFPIKDIQSRVLGFGARALDESLPKYINSPQTLVFDKSNMLYGIERAQTAIKQKEQAIIVEGYMDVLTSHQYGWENTVATMGTSLTNKQLHILKRLTKNIVLALDADLAGKQATLRSEDIIEQAMDKKSVTIFEQSSGFKLAPVIDADIRVAIFSSGKDPDEIIRDDSSKWDKLIIDARNFIDFAISTVIDEVDLNNPKEKSSAVERLLPLLSRIEDPIQSAHYRRKLAKLIQVGDKDISSALDSHRSQQRNKRPLRINENEVLATKTTRFLTSNLAIEEYCLALLLKYSDLRSWIAVLLPEYFERTENRELMLKLKENNDYVTIKDSLDSSLHNYLENLQSKNFPPSVDENDNIRQQTMSDCMLRLQEKWLRNFEAKKAELLAIEAEAGGTEAELNKLQEQGIEEHKQLKDIFNRRASNLTTGVKEE